MNRIFRNFCLLSAIAVLAALTAGCGLYTKFNTPEYEETDSAYGEVAPAADSLSTGDICWRDFFNDDKLADLIDTALVHNVDLATALLKIDEAQADLKAAKLAYVPSFNLPLSATYINPATGGSKSYSAVNSDAGGWSISLPVSASWQLDIFGSLTNAKRRQLAATMSSYEYARAVHAALVATVATEYYTLLALDAQYVVYQQTEKNWKENVQATEDLMEAGKYKSSAVSQAKANYYSVLNNLIDIEYQINEIENAINSLLGRVSGTPVIRGTLEDWNAPEIIEVGIPATVLSNRPDVRQAEYALAQAHYALCGARASFYPSLTITGSFSFYEVLANAVGSLTQPIFQNGKLRANLKVAKAQYAELEASFRQSIIDAGIEVNNAVANLNGAKAKVENYAQQVSNLEDAVESTQALMTHGSTTYLEVLTAQQSLLSAQIGEIGNKLSEISGAISLYQALGGGGDDPEE